MNQVTKATVHFLECQKRNDTSSTSCTTKPVLGDITNAENIYIACGHTNMRKSIAGLVGVVKEQSRWLMEGLKVEQKQEISVSIKSV